MKMMKLILLLAALGSVLCETHDQQVEYADHLIEEIKELSYVFTNIIENIRGNTESEKLRLLVHANSLIFNTHFILDCLQHVVFENHREAEALQEIVLKLNRITYALEKSMNSDVEVLKTQLLYSVEDIVYVAEHLGIIIVKNTNLAYTSTVLRFLDDLLNAITTDYFRATTYGVPNKSMKGLVLVLRSALSASLDLINSTHIHVRNDIVRYSSKLSSVISETGRLLDDLTFTFKTDNITDVKEIIYSLSKIVQDNEEVLYKENSFAKIKNQLGVTIDDFVSQLYKILDAGYSKDGWTVKDKHLIYIIPQQLALATKLERNLRKTINNYIDTKYISNY